MKKMKLAILLLVLTLTLFGCAKPRALTLKLDCPQDIYLASVPKGTDHGRVSNDVLTADVYGDGEYTFVFRDGSMQDYSVTVKVHGDQVETETSEGINATASIQ